MLMKYHQLPSSFQKCTHSLKKTITYLPNGPVSLNPSCFHGALGGFPQPLITQRELGQHVWGLGPLSWCPHQGHQALMPPAIRDYFLSVPKSTMWSTAIISFRQIPRLPTEACFYIYRPWDLFTFGDCYFDFQGHHLSNTLSTMTEEE